MGEGMYGEASRGGEGRAGLMAKAREAVGAAGVASAPAGVETAY